MSLQNTAAASSSSSSRRPSGSYPRLPPIAPPKSPGVDALAALAKRMDASNHSHQGFSSARLHANPQGDKLKRKQSPIAISSDRTGRLRAGAILRARSREAAAGPSTSAVPGGSTTMSVEITTPPSAHRHHHSHAHMPRTPSKNKGKGKERAVTPMSQSSSFRVFQDKRNRTSDSSSSDGAMIIDISSDVDDGEVEYLGRDFPSIPSIGSLDSTKKAQAPAPPAASPAQTRLDALKDMLDCDVCYEPLNRPYAVNACGHEFCGKCLKDWFEKARQDNPASTLECPTCRTAVVGKPIRSFKLQAILELLLDSAAPANSAPAQDDKEYWKDLFPTTKPARRERAARAVVQPAQAAAGPMQIAPIPPYVPRPAPNPAPPVVAVAPPAPVNAPQAPRLAAQLQYAGWPPFPPAPPPQVPVPAAAMNRDPAGRTYIYATHIPSTSLPLALRTRQGSDLFQRGATHAMINQLQLTYTDVQGICGRAGGAHVHFGWIVPPWMRDLATRQEQGQLGAGFPVGGVIDWGAVVQSNIFNEPYHWHLDQAGCWHRLIQVSAAI